MEQEEDSKVPAPWPDPRPCMSLSTPSEWQLGLWSSYNPYWT